MTGCICPYIISELRRVLERKFDENHELVEDFIERLLSDLTLVPDRELDIVRDPDDKIVLGSAVEGRCDFLVTGDSDLRVLGKVKDTAIVTGREFIVLRG